MSRLANELIEIKEEIEEARYKIAKLEGEDEGLKKTLSDKYNCKNTQEAKEEIKRLRKALNKKRSAVEQAMARLSKVFNKE